MTQIRIFFLPASGTFYFQQVLPEIFVKSHNERTKSLMILTKIAEILVSAGKI